MLGIAGCALLLVGLATGWLGSVPWTLVLLGAAYAAFLARRDEDAAIDASAPLYAAGLLVLAELAYWSIELRGPGREESTLLLRRLVALLVLAFVSLALGAFVVVITALPAGSGLLWDVVGVAAAIGALAIVARLARRPG